MPGTHYGTNKRNQEALPSIRQASYSKCRAGAGRYIPLAAIARQEKLCGGGEGKGIGYTMLQMVNKWLKARKLLRRRSQNAEPPPKYPTYTDLHSISSVLGEVYIGGLPDIQHC